MSSSIQPCYSLPVASVYRDAFLAMLCDTQRLDALINCFLGVNNPHRLPSWVPDWSLPADDRPGAVLSVQLASGISRAEAHFYPPNILRVSGVHFATVREVKGPVPKGDKQASVAII